MVERLPDLHGQPSSHTSSRFRNIASLLTLTGAACLNALNRPQPESPDHCSHDVLQKSAGLVDFTDISAGTSLVNESIHYILEHPDEHPEKVTLQLERVEEEDDYIIHVDERRYRIANTIVPLGRGSQFVDHVRKTADGIEIVSEKFGTVKIALLQLDHILHCLDAPRSDTRRIPITIQVTLDLNPGVGTAYDAWASVKGWFGHSSETETVMIVFECVPADLHLAANGT